MATEWRSDSTLRCAAAGSAGDVITAFATVAMQRGSLQSFLSHDRPKATVAPRPNFPNIGGREIGLDGSNFALADYTVKVRIGSTAAQA
eukprot:1745281-Rhodomonas_salina.1